MIISAGWSKAKKRGRPELGYSSDCDTVSCSVELDMPDELAADPAKMREQIKKLHEAVYHAVEDELILRTPADPAPSSRQAGDDDVDLDDPDVRPGDRVYERSRPALTDDRSRPAQADDRGGWRGDVDPPENDERPSDRGRRHHDERERDRIDERRDDRRPAPLQDDRRPARRDDRGRSGGGQRTSYGPPRNAKAFAGWFASLNDTDEGKDLQKEVYKLMRAWNLPTICKELTNDEAIELYNEIDQKFLNGAPRGTWGRRGDGPPARVNAGYGGERSGARNGDGRGR